MKKQKFIIVTYDEQGYSEAYLKEVLGKYEVYVTDISLIEEEEITG